MAGRAPPQQHPSSRLGATGESVTRPSGPGAGGGTDMPGNIMHHHQEQRHLPPSSQQQQQPMRGMNPVSTGGPAQPSPIDHAVIERMHGQQQRQPIYPTQQSQQGSQQQQQEQQQTTTARPKRKTSKAACERCRKLKRKCNGNRPCEACVEQGQECVFTSDPHVSRSVAKRQRLEVLEEEIVEMRRTLDQLRDRPEPEAIDMLRRLRHRPDAKYSIFPRTRSPLRVDLATRFPNVYSLTLPQTIAETLTIATPPSSITVLEAPRWLLTPQARAKLVEGEVPATARQEEQQQPTVSSSSTSSERDARARYHQQTRHLQQRHHDPGGEESGRHQQAAAADPFSSTNAAAAARTSPLDADTSPRSSYPSSDSAASADERAFPSLPSDPSPQNTRKINYDAFVDPRLAAARAAPWTSIVTDDRLFRILLSLYLAWYHPAFPMFDQDLFVGDLIAGHGEFCSSHLVHAILIMPCKYYPKARHLSEPFLTHAEQLHHAEEGEQKLTTVQAISITGTALQILGRDKVGYLRQACALRIATDIGLLTRARTRSHQFTIWGLYFMINLSAICLRKPSFFRVPPTVSFPEPGPNDSLSSGSIRQSSATATATTISRSSSLAGSRPTTSVSDITAAAGAIFAAEATEGYGDHSRGGGPSTAQQPQPQPQLSTSQQPSWSPYPYAGARPATFVASFSAACRFWGIAGEISMPYERDRKWLSLDEAENVYARLLEWSESCGAEVKPTATSTPDVLLLHMWFHISVIELFRPFRDRGFARVQSLASSDSRVELISAESLEQLKALIMVYASQYDCRLAHGSFLQALLVCSFELIRHLNRAESCRLFLLCYRILIDLSVIIPVVTPVLRVIEEAARAANASMHPEVLRLFDEGRRRQQELMQQQRFQAAYAIDLDIVGNSVEAARMDHLIEKWDTVL